MSDRAARLLSAVFHPILTGAYVLVLTGMAGADTPAEGLAFSLLTLIIATGIPAADLMVRLRTGSVTSIDVAVRQQRLRPLLVTLVCCLVAVATLTVLGGPFTLTVSLLAALSSGAILAGVTRYWKISFHTAVFAGGIVLLVWAAGPFAAWTVAVLPAIGWARVRLGRHTPAQVSAGALAGAAACAAVVFVAEAWRG